MKKFFVVCLFCSLFAFAGSVRADLVDPNIDWNRPIKPIEDVNQPLVNHDLPIDPMTDIPAVKESFYARHTLEIAGAGIGVIVLVAIFALIKFRQND
jgi:hypothetical protein